ncbi:MAG: carboxypeptidase M32 [Candidatus Sumerlaeia bacterium]
MVTCNELYSTLMERMAELSDLSATMALLSWDQETYMPAGSQQARALQSSTLSAISHQRFTDPAVGDLLKRLQADTPPDVKDQRIAVDRVAWEYERATKIPESLVREMAQAQSDSVAAWSAAKEKDDFPTFQPHLEKLLELERQYADCLKRDGQSRYDVLVEGYERGMTRDKISTIFTNLREWLAPFVQEIANSKNPVDASCLAQPFDEDKQWEFGLRILKDMGFDFDHGRQDRSAHPFTNGFHPQDVRITTRINPNHLSPGLFATIHEGGHALYEQGFDPNDYRGPLASSISLGIHESQSRMWENMVGRSMPFWKHYYASLQETFPQLKDISLDAFYRAANQVQPSLIRVEADEVTYSLHIILRFELEQALLDGELPPADLPGIWREKMKEYLGIEPEDDRTGCLQDIHWAWGLVGYFPTYTLGNLYAAQMFETARKEIPNLEEHIAKGELLVLKDWLREKVHRVGNRRLADELVEDITGRAPEAKPYMEYIEKKFGAIYGIR